VLLQYIILDAQGRNVYKVTFNKPGTYQFYCDIHGGIVINIVVK